MTTDNEFKNKGLAEELRLARDKNLKLASILRDIEKNSKMQHEHMIRLEEQNRDLKQ
jgi:hypothetical protein